MFPALKGMKCQSSTSCLLGLEGFIQGRQGSGAKLWRLRVKQQSLETSNALYGVFPVPWPRDLPHSYLLHHCFKNQWFSSLLSTTSLSLYSTQL